MERKAVMLQRGTFGLKRTMVVWGSDATRIYIDVKVEIARSKKILNLTQDDVKL